MIAVVALMCAAVVAVVWLGQRAAALVRLEQREERERGLAPRIEGIEKAMRDVHTQQQTFMANNRR